jgi:predicted dienelactone hydrolase
VAGYDPFVRGPFPVGVRTARIDRDARSLPLEIWYPATDDYAGQDVAEESADRYEVLPGLPSVRQDAVRDAVSRPGRHPLVAFSHGYGGHRRQSTFLCTHLASHGYVVAAVDHVGNTIFDVMRAVLAVQAGEPRPDPGAVLREFIGLRPSDVSTMIDRVLDGTTGLGGLVDPERIGMAGHSFGGWTTLAVAGRDRRIRAALPLAPAGGESPLPVGPLRESLDLRWDRDVPTLYVVASRDTLLPLGGMHDLFARTGSRKRMVVIENADHMHFCDRVEEVHEMFRLMPGDPLFAELQQSIPPIADLCPGEHGYVAVRGLGLAHMDAHLRGDERAARFLGGDLRATFGARGVAVAVH